MKKIEKFPKRVVLAVGYPWAMGDGVHKEISMCEESIGINCISLNWPKVLWKGDVPKYRLVLEKME